MKYNYKNKKGFTLLETLVAVFILSLALTGPIYIATLAIRSSVESRDYLSAYYLAEEAIEVVRNNRDTIALNATIPEANWLTGITGSADCFNTKDTISNICKVDRQSALTGAYTFTECVGNCAPLSFDKNASIIYGNTGPSSEAINSKFTREIYLQTAQRDPSTSEIPQKEVDVVVTIKWKDKGNDKSFRLIDRLHNQQYSKYYIK